jgi:hypothetical protein
MVFECAAYGGEFLSVHANPAFGFFGSCNR